MNIMIHYGRCQARISWDYVKLLLKLYKNGHLAYAQVVRGPKGTLQSLIQLPRQTRNNE